MEATHPDFAILAPIASAIHRLAGGEVRLNAAVPRLLQDAIDFVLDPIRTARTKLVEIDNVEKTFVGLKVEHFFRDFLNVPKGLRDLTIDGVDVDVKNTVGSTWTIPPETYLNSEPVLLFLIADALGHCSVGLLVARSEYLSGSENRDKKKSLVAASRRHIMWLLKEAPLPDSRWVGIDMERFRELRSVKGGSKRAAQFFRENMDRPIHRSIVQALLFDQLDYMKRLRGNGGARDLLGPEGIVLLSGKYDHAEIAARDLAGCGEEEFIATAR